MMRLMPLLIVILAPHLTVAASQRNVVVIVADDLGFQLGCYGDKVAKTPNIDRLASQSMRFTRAYCTTASCSASRTASAAAACRTRSS